MRDMGIEAVVKVADVAVEGEGVEGARSMVAEAGVAGEVEDEAEVVAEAEVEAEPPGVTQSGASRSLPGVLLRRSPT